MKYANKKQELFQWSCRVQSRENFWGLLRQIELTKDRKVNISRLSQGESELEEEETMWTSLNWRPWMQSCSLASTKSWFAQNFTMCGKAHSFLGVSTELVLKLYPIIIANGSCFSAQCIQILDTRDCAVTEVTSTSNVA